MSDDFVKYTHLVGRAGKDVESQKASKPLAKFTLAVEAGYDKEKRSVVTEWVDVAAWDRLAEAMFDSEGNPLVLKGMRIWVAGQASIYHGPSGDRKQINAREIGVVDRFRVGIAGSSPSMVDPTGGASYEAETKKIDLDGISEEEPW